MGEGSSVFIMCVSGAYKESYNCRLEAEYACQMKKQIIPVMMQENYKANGWLGIMLGTKLWYPLWKKDLLESKGPEIVKMTGKFIKITRPTGKIVTETQKGKDKTEENEGIDKMT